jgi:transposase
MPRMPHSSVPSQVTSDPEEVVVGVDTHKDVHVAAVLTVLGVLRESREFPATAAGYQALLAWVCTFGILRRAGVECTGSYGAGPRPNPRRRSRRPGSPQRPGQRQRQSR